MTSTTDTFPTAPQSAPAGGAGPATALPKAPLARLPLAGGLIACAALALSIVLGPDAGSHVVTGLAVLAALVLVLALGHRGLTVARTGAGAQLGVAVLGLGFIGALWIATVTIGGGQLGLAAWGTALGAALVIAGATRTRRRSTASGTPWQRIAGGSGRDREARAAAVDLMLLFGGGIVLLIGAVAAWGFLRDRLIYGSGGIRELVYVAFAGGVGIVLFALALLGGFWVWRQIGGAPADPGATNADSRTSAAPGTTRDEPTIAAHLHDSVLQTLALINRSADDPARVRQLARQQERSLRAWLAGRDEAQADSLAGAVKVAAQEVEDEEPGARIEVVAVGDAPLDRGADAMVRAAREAMRNAVRHAGSPVRVFVEVDGAVREVFVRDTGPGFDPAAVAEERRGVRDAIIGRMEHVGGTATIDSAAGGTEVALRYAAPATGNGAA